jgi:hypothetical protein
VLGGAVAIAAGGFAYMSTSGAVSTSYGSTEYAAVNGYAVYDVYFVAGDPINNSPSGTVGYIHFSTIPMNNIQSNGFSWPASGQVKVAGSWYSCTTVWNGVDSRKSTYGDSFSTATGVTDVGSPQATWTCDIRGTTDGVSADTWASVNSLEFLILG